MHDGIDIYLPTRLCGERCQLLGVALLRHLGKVEMRPQRAFGGIGSHTIKSRFRAKCFPDQRYGLSLREPLRCVCYSRLPRSLLLMSGRDEPELPACFLQKLLLRVLHDFGAGIARVMHADSMLVQVERGRTETFEFRWKHTACHLDQRLLICRGM